MNYVPHQAHTHKKKPNHILRIKTISEECIFPVINPQKQEAKHAVSHPNARWWGWRLGLSCPQGYWSKRLLLTDRRLMAFSCAQSERQYYFLVQSTKTSTALDNPSPTEEQRARHCNLDPKSLLFHWFCHTDRFSFIWHKNQMLKEARKTRDSYSPDIMLMLLVI